MVQIRVGTGTETRTVLFSGDVGRYDKPILQDPERFDVTRYAEGKDAAPHLSFGGGAHLCLGAHLARLETQIAIGTLVRRFDGLTLESESTEWGRSLFRVPARIPVRFVERRE